MQQRLPLPASAFQIAAAAVIFHLRHVPLDRSPAFDLPLVIGTTPAQEYRQYHLEPAARVFFVNPTFLAPYR